MIGERWHELWATFSVKDHCIPGAYLAEVLLYDHLLVPMVPMQRDGLSAEEAEQEWKRWHDNGWQPAKLNQLLAILGQRATPIPWTRALQDEWNGKMASAESPSMAALTQDIQAARPNGYCMSGTVLERFAPRMAKTVVAVAQYRSLEDLQRNIPVRPVQPAAPVAAGTLLAVLGHELLVPSDPDRDDFKLLVDAVDVAGDETYREKRKKLYLWQQEFVGSDSMTDPTSIQRGVQEMQDLVRDVNTATKRQSVWKVFKNIFSFLKIGTSAVNLVEPVGAKAFGSAVSVGDYVLDRFEPNFPGGEATPAAALLLDAQRRLNLTVTGERRV